MAVSPQIAGLIEPNLENRTKKLIRLFAEKAHVLDEAGNKYKHYLLSSSGLPPLLLIHLFIHLKRKP